MEKIYIGIAGVSEQPSPRLTRLASEFLEKVKTVGVRVSFILGGYWGFMKHFADRAIESGHEVIFVLPSEPIETPPNKPNTVIIQTDLGPPSRSTILCKSSDVLVVFGGRVGCMIESLLAYSFGKPVIIIESGYETDKLAKCYPKHFDVRMSSQVYFASSVDEVVNLVKSYVERLREGRAVI